MNIPANGRILENNRHFPKNCLKTTKDVQIGWAPIPPQVLPSPLLAYPYPP